MALASEEIVDRIPERARHETEDPDHLPGAPEVRRRMKDGVRSDKHALGDPASAGLDPDERIHPAKPRMPLEERETELTAQRREAQRVEPLAAQDQPHTGTAHAAVAVVEDHGIRVHAALGTRRASRHRRQRSSAASGQFGKEKENPAAESRPGTTRRLFRISSVSVRRKNAPISSIHASRAGRLALPHASSQRAHELGVGQRIRRGEVDGALDVVLLDQPTDGADEIGVVNPRDVLAADRRPCPPRPRRTRRSRTSKTPPRSGLITIAERSSTFRVPGVDGLARAAASHAFATSMLKRQVSGASGSSPPMMPVASSFGAS